MCLISNILQSPTWTQKTTHSHSARRGEGEETAEATPFLKQCCSTSVIWWLPRFQDKPFFIPFCLLEHPTPSGPHKRPHLGHFDDKIETVRRELLSPHQTCTCAHLGSQRLPPIKASPPFVLWVRPLSGLRHFAPDPPPPALAKLSLLSTRSTSLANKCALWLPLRQRRPGGTSSSRYGPISFLLFTTKLYKSVAVLTASTSSPSP